MFFLLINLAWIFFLSYFVDCVLMKFNLCTNQRVLNSEMLLRETRNSAAALWPNTSNSWYNNFTRQSCSILMNMQNYVGNCTPSKQHELKSEAKTIKRQGGERIYDRTDNKMRNDLMYIWQSHNSFLVLTRIQVSPSTFNSLHPLRSRERSEIVSSRVVVQVDRAEILSLVRSVLS